MRAFFGIPCPESVRETLEPMAVELADTTNIKTVRPENYHLTVKFLGDISQSDCRDFDSLLQSRLPTPGPLKLDVEHVGVFPSMEHPSVVWAGIEPTESLQLVHDEVESVALDLDFDPEDHDFRPHVTLGRYKNSMNNKQKLLEWIQNYGDEHFASFEAGNLHLYESELTQDGPIYSSLVSWPL
ncbi:MAG: RNA 2',3'-cyclic phosphodiesterase [bacterium]